MKTTTLGRSGLQVSRIAFGTWSFGGDWGSVDTDAAQGAIRYARELGVNFFDTAQELVDEGKIRHVGVSNFDEHQVAALPEVDVAIVGARSRRNIERSLAAVDVELTADDLARIDQITTAGHEVQGATPEGVD
jgi:aryl-alcohol dehydrogenase-like predicted oxidoreductase